MKALSFAFCLVVASLAIATNQACGESEPTPELAPDPALIKPAAMGLADFENLALQHNPTLRQAAASVAASRATALQAGLWPNPQVGYSGELIGADGTAGEFQGTFIQQTIVTVGKRRISRAKYNQQAREAELREVQQQMRVVNGVRTHFFKLLAQQRLITLRELLLANAQEHLRTTEQMVNNGQATRPDLLLAEIELSRAKVALITSQNHYLNLWRNLAAIVGTPDLPPSPIVGVLDPQCPPLDWDGSLKRILADSPELLAAKAHIVYAQITLQRERRQPYPNIWLKGGVGYSPEDRSTVGGVKLGVRLPIWNRNQGTIQQVQADLANALAEIERVRLSLQQRLSHQFQKYQTAYVTAKIHRESNIPKAKEAYDIQQEMYKQRRAPWPDVVRFRSEWLNARTDYIQSLLDLRQAEVAIKGLLIVDGLSTPSKPAPPGHIAATPQPR